MNIDLNYSELCQLIDCCHIGIEFWLKMKREDQTITEHANDYINEIRNIRIRLIHLRLEENNRINNILSKTE